jgi:hypothetical protein
VAFEDDQMLACRVDEVQLTFGGLLVQRLVALESRRAVAAFFYNSDTIKPALVFVRVRLQCLDDEPAFGIGFAHGFPIHGILQ